MNFFTVDNDELIVLNLWGGQQTYYKKEKKYSIIRNCGIFSNLTVILYGIFVLKVKGYDVEDLEIVMTDYYFDKDVYPILFRKNNTQLNFDDVSEEEINFFWDNCCPSICGLGLKSWSATQSTKENFGLKITNKIIQKYFLPSHEVLNSYNKMVLDKNLYNNDYIFIWARKTDKIEETNVPNAEKYFELLCENNLLNERIFIQTDDLTMFEDFKKINFNFEYFSEIPFATGYSFHRNISHTDDNVFYEMYKMTKDEYLVKMMCVVLLAANSKIPIIYPGNPTTVVPMYKNSFDNCILFKDDKEIF